MNKWDEKKDILIDLIQVQDLPYEQIGRMFNCSGNNIKKVAKRLGIELKQKRKINESETFNKGKCRKGVCLNCGERNIQYIENPDQENFVQTNVRQNMNITII